MVSDGLEFVADEPEEQEGCFCQNFCHGTKVISASIVENLVLACIFERVI